MFDIYHILIWANAQKIGSDWIISEPPHKCDDLVTELILKINTEHTHTHTPSLKQASSSNNALKEAKH